MHKKTYIAPGIELVRLNMESPILVGSETVNIITPVNPSDPNDGAGEDEVGSNRYTWLGGSDTW